MSTVDASFLDKKVNVGERTVKLNIWDTAGQEKYHALAKNYYQGASGKLIIFEMGLHTDVHRRTTCVRCD